MMENSPQHFGHSSFKELISRRKNIVIILLILLVIVCFAVTMFLLTRPNITPTNYSPSDETVSSPQSTEPTLMPKTGEIVLTKACPAENQEIIANVPADWNCQKYSLENPVIRDLAVRNSGITIAFPLDVQMAIGCGINQPNCTFESFYTSAKVTRMDKFIESGKVKQISGSVKVDDITVAVIVTFNDKNKTEVTPDEQALIVKILENITKKPLAATVYKDVSFNLSGGGENNYTLALKIPENSTVTETPRNGVNPATYLVENSEYSLKFFIPTEAFETQYNTKVEVGVLGNIGSMVYRVRGVNMQSDIMVYSNDTKLINGENCVSMNVATDPPCGYPLLKVKIASLNISCTEKSIKSYDICDDIIKRLEII